MMAIKILGFLLSLWLLCYLFGAILVGIVLSPITIFMLRNRKNVYMTYISVQKLS